MLLMYTILLVSNFLLTNHVLGKPPRLDPKPDLNLPSGGPSSSAPLPTEGDEGGLQLTQKQWLKRCFLDARKQVRKNYNLEELKPDIALKDLLKYFGGFYTVVTKTTNYLNAKNIDADTREHINLELFSEIVEEYCRGLFPIYKFVQWRWQGSNPKRDPELDDLYSDLDPFQDSDIEY